MGDARRIARSWVPALTVFLTASLFAAPQLRALDLEVSEAWRLIDDLDSPDPAVRARAREATLASGDRGLAPALVEVIFFSRNGRDDANDILEGLLEEKVDRSARGHGYKGWLEVIGRREEIAPKRGYAEYKARQYSRIDPAFAAWLSSSVPATIRLEEIVFGGVRKDGIPALTLPAHLAAAGASWLRDDDPVFGALLGGQARAYPRRIVASHEIVNDVLGGRAVTLAFCTLCGSAILYDASPRDGEVLTFGTSGLLYRSNKLMYDRQTNSLWSQLLGRPVVGPLVGSGLELRVLPMVVTTWREWRSLHPETTVLSIETGYRRDYEAPYAEYFASPDLMFPVWKRSDALDLKDRVWVVKANGVEKAYALQALLGKGVLNDAIADTTVVLIADSAAGSVRAWARGSRRFERAERAGVRDETGTLFRISDEKLVSDDGTVSLEPLPGFESYWFGWYAIHGESEVYLGD